MTELTTGLPKPFTDKMKNLLGDEFDSFLQGYNVENYKGLRLNPLKYGYENFPVDLFKLAPVPWAPFGFYYPDDMRPGRHPYHEAGLYYIQEPSAMSAAALLRPAPGDIVLDLCGAPGGKSTQLAGFMNQQGLLISNEIHPARAKILSQNIERLGIANAIVTNEDSATLADRLPDYFDRILVDAPCSGEGMFRKNDEACNEWSPENVKICSTRQLEILDNAAVMLKAGGTMVYSTCTFSPEENENVIGEFLESHPEFSTLKTEAPYFEPGRPEWGNGASYLADTFRLWPHKLHGEGHFVAILKKDGITSAATDRRNKKSDKNNKKLSKADIKMLDEFLSQTVDDSVRDYILSGRLMYFGEQLYLLPEGTPSLDGLHVLRPGLHIGTRKKDRLEPSHALALFLNKNQAKSVVSFSSDSREISDYLHGDSLVISDSDFICKTSDKGWTLVCVDNYSIGWGKYTQGQLKNHYPKGLRTQY